jgi:hypothetical protein
MPWMQMLGSLAPYAIAVGLIVSVASSGIFYLLLKYYPSPPTVTPDSTAILLQQWPVAYQHWTSSYTAYASDYGVSILASIGFAVTSGVFLFPRISMLVSFALINVFTAWTSHTFQFFSQPLATFLTKEITAEDYFLWGFLNNDSSGVRTLMVADVEALAMLVILTTVVLLFNIKKGKKQALLRAVQAMSLCFLILGSEILVFDYSEFYLHVTQVQESFTLAMWFTNADLFFVGLVAFAASTWLLRSPTGELIRSIGTRLPRMIQRAR